jgi:GntR family transcriptional repressor for pyruvate dehydrogenase complex
MVQSLNLSPKETAAPQRPWLRAIKTQRAFEAISQQIHNRIAAGELKIDDRLPNERELARTLEVSRHAVREALRTLESVGLVRLSKGARGGAFISAGRPDAVADVMRGIFMIGGIPLEQLTEARLWMESLVVRVACERADNAAFDTLEQNLRLTEREIRAGHLAEKARLNIEFHDLLAAATGNQVVVLMMGAILSVLRDFVERIGLTIGMDVIHSRRRLLRHMRARDGAKAVAEIERHLKVLHRRYLKLLTHPNGAVPGSGYDVSIRQGPDRTRERAERQLCQ